ncbi:hypothetical protein OAD44_00905 [Flavobacteriaceae bacterium]|nr:hypothetical protein [Flavobacteriaceae bacterium]
MKIKDITLSIFAIIGFVTILSSFNNQSQETHSTVPESHEWEFIDRAVPSVTYLFNKKTGEMRMFRTISDEKEAKDWDAYSLESVDSKVR